MQGEQVFILCINQAFDVVCPRAVIVTLDEVGPFDRGQFEGRDVVMRYQQLTLPATHK